MIVDVNFQIISPIGWMELREGLIQTRENGHVIEEQTVPGMMHVHDGGVFISLPTQLVRHLLKTIEYDFSHDQSGKPLPNPIARPIRVVVRT